MSFYDPAKMISKLAQWSYICITGGYLGIFLISLVPTIYGDTNLPPPHPQYPIQTSGQ